MSLLGNRVVRVEDHHILLGNAQYVSNAEIPGAASAAFVTSPYAHARILSCDTSEALALDGVIAVFTHEDLALEPARSMIRDRQDTARPYLATDRVRFVGEPIAVVIAEDARTAFDACDLVVIDYEPLNAVADPETALSDDPQLFESGSNVLVTFGEPFTEGFFDDAEVVISQKMVNQRLAPAPLEGRAAAAWPGPDGRLNFLASTQSTHAVKAALCGALAREPESVVVRAADVGGGFGAKGSPYPEDIVIAACALALDRPVRWVEDRSRSMVGLVHGRAQVQYLELGAHKDGTITGLRLRMVQDAGAYASLGAMLPRLTALMSSGAYRIPKIATFAQSVVTNTTPTGAYRGAGRPEAAAAIERMIDLLANRLDLDPAEVRRRNFIPSTEFPYTTASGATYDSGDYVTGLEAILKTGNYDRLHVEQARRREAGSQRVLGIGLASYIEITNGFSSSEYARVVMEPEGRVSVYSGTAPHGQGHATAWAMLVNDQLGIEIDKIKVITGDTDLVPRGVGTFGSRSLQVGGVAVSEAAQEVLKAAKTRASDLLEADPADITVTEDGTGLMVAGTPSSALSWDTLIANGGPLEATVDHEATLPTFPFGTHMAVVEVDTESGKVEVMQYYALDDAGKIVNPMLAEGQVHGGIAQGIAQALLEVMLYSPDGTPMTPTLADYGFISSAELPSFHISHQETPSPINALGVKGIGESGTTGATPAVWNAVIDAVSHLGISHIELPLTPENVWRALQH